MWRSFSSPSLKTEISFCFSWTCSCSSFITFWCCVTFFPSSLFASLNPSSLDSHSAMLFFNWKFSWSSSLFFLKVEFIKAWADDSSSLSVSMSFSKYFFSDLTVSRTVSLPSAAVVLWSNLVCSSCSLHCTLSSSSSAFLRLPLSSFISSPRRVLAAFSRSFWAWSWVTSSCFISNWSIAVFISSCNFNKAAFALPSSPWDFSFCPFKTCSFSFKASRLFSNWELFTATFASRSCKLCSLAMLFWRFSSASLRLYFNRVNSDSSSHSSSSFKLLCGGVDWAITLFSWTDSSSTFKLFNKSLVWSSSSFNVSLSVLKASNSFCLFPKSFLLCNISPWNSAIWFSAMARSSRCLAIVSSNVFSFFFSSSFSLFTCTNSSLIDSISEIFSLSSSWAICSVFVAFCSRSLRLERLLCWAMISSWSCWCPPRSFSHSPIALVILLLNSADFSSKCALADFNSSIWQFFTSFSFFAVSKRIFCPTYCLLSLSISFRFVSPLFVASSNWLCRAKLSLCSFSYLSSKSDIVLFTSTTSSRRAFLSLSHSSCVTFRSSRSLWDFEFSNWESRKFWRDILRSWSSFEILALLFSISFSRMACRSLLCSNTFSKCCWWRGFSCPLPLSSRSFTRVSTVVSYWFSLRFKEVTSSWAPFSFDSLDSW